MTKTEKYLLGGGIIGLLGLAFYGSRQNEADAAPAGAGASLGDGTVIQQRPLPAWDRLDDASRAREVMGMQQQLNYLGLGPVPVDGAPDGDATAGALAGFVGTGNGAARARAYGNGYGALLLAVDDLVRERSGEPRAPDYVAPGGGASGRLAREPASGATAIETPAQRLATMGGAAAMAPHAQAPGANAVQRARHGGGGG